MVTAMKIPRMSIVTLGVNDLKKSTAFYRKVLHVAPTTKYEGVTFFQMPGVWLGLFPLRNLAKDISKKIIPKRYPFSGMSLAHNTRSKNDVDAIFRRAKKSGAKIIRAPHNTFWGGYSGYFADLDGFHWEIAWGPMFEFKKDGTLSFKKGI